ncbi:xanthine dehydrogenase family protein molybdopterin-binding subunit [Noviherbaspirillum pedocola]|uniref:Xanthine dehydrogenase family protein molybdopterin-binding subunit n=1 Tax=Noviherbaspirillum pedocola TaxID=2801341 RepID=A0A934WAA9_9BURK|nr:molybdopterin cofactor-binding domain-containing protein [Noviherbaspirillum pedocola]MBK4738414.1 xanthine dehydrogenase family protein molybdopterin-binding subunit [Noviherbaspirillum pedocola]
MTAPIHAGRPQRPSRRAFLRDCGAIVVSFAFTGPLAAQTSTPKDKLDLYRGLDSWLAVDEAGRVTVYCGKVELGTGVRTGLTQIVAEELDLPMASITMIMGDTALVPDQGTTTGSKTIQLGGPPLRRAAAEARAALAELAAARLNLATERIAVRDGYAFDRDAPQRRLSFAELIGGRRFERRIGKPAEKPIAAYRIVGQPVPRVDLPAKLMGNFEYVQNVRVPGMLHGRVVRPAAIGATLVRVDDASVRGLGARVVVRGNFVGVVAAREETAILAAQRLRVEWKLPEGAREPVDVHAEMRGYPSRLKPVAAKGDIDAGFGHAAAVIEASYATPFQMHGSIGPSCAVADVRTDGATVWCGTQHSFGLVTAVAQALGMAPERVRIAWTEASGCYGHNGSDDAALDAALMSQATAKPVRVQWMRQDEHRWEPKGPAMLIDLKAGVDANGNIVAWDFLNLTATHSTRPRHHAGNTLAGQLIGFAPAHALSNGERNADVGYAFDAKRVRMRYHESSPLRPSALRGLAAYPNTFANESFIDELAARAGADALAYRLAYVTDERARAVLETVARIAQWQSGAAPLSQREAVAPSTSARGMNAKRGRGIAWCRYENAHAYVAVVAEAEVDANSGRVRVTRLFAAQDCGLIVNPDGARNQVEGCLVQGMSRALFEEVTFHRGGVDASDWMGYPIARFEDVPETVAVELIDRPDQPSVGSGEAATCPVAAAIGNAIFDAAGIRLREYPFTPQRVRAALAQGTPA